MFSRLSVLRKLGDRLRETGTPSRCSLVVFCTVILVVLFTWALGVTGLGPIDDHRFIAKLFQGKSFGFYVNPELGRFFPLTAQEYVFAAWIIEPTPQLFYSISGLKALLCGVLLLHCLILTKAGNLVAAIHWGVAMLSIGVANTLFRLSAGELSAFMLMLVFVWTNLFVEGNRASQTKKKIAAIGGTVAFFAALLTKEVIFVFGLAFASSEFVRYYRKRHEKVPKHIVAILLISVMYIAAYGIWRATYVTGSYASLHSRPMWDAVAYFAKNDPFIIAIVLPLTAYRFLLVMRDRTRHTIYDSLLLAACAYVAAYLALRMNNSYYLLPAYAFGICGVAGLLASQVSQGVKAAVVAFAGLCCINALPVTVSDLQAQRSIANNHYDFARSLSEWLVMNPLPDSKSRNLVLAGVTSGKGVEILFSLRKFLESFGVPSRSFEVKAAEPSDDVALSSFHGLESNAYIRKEHDLVIFNPYQSKVVRPPLLAPSYREIYRSGSESALPRWAGWHWVKFCVLRHRHCMARIAQSMRYTGYSAMLLVRHPTAVTEPIVLSDFSFRIGASGLASRIRAGSTQRLKVLVENTGTEMWLADGTLGPVKFVHLAYRWFDEKGKVVLEGGRAAFPEPMQPNDKAKVSLVIKTPAKPGKYRLLIGPIQEGVRWFPGGDAREIEVF